MSEVSTGGGVGQRHTDGSGNTGDDVFNVDRPDFYTLTLLSEDDLNVVAAPHAGRLDLRQRQE
jgi:hypothetical protein